MKPADYYQFLDLSWHEETARNSLDRWVDICNKENWSYSKQQMETLVRIFGASWYFTRYIFVYGDKISELLFQDENNESGIIDTKINIDDVIKYKDLEESIEQLRKLKNTIMFKILLAFLKGNYALEQTERDLTVLAENILSALFTVLEVKTSCPDIPITILGMGRMAGYEMTFGSDLDLIFLFENDDDIMNPELSTVIRLLLRTIAQPSASGLLYEVDMRLRPHGNSGPLVTTYKTFLEYHQGNREIWERQLMTRCRPVLVKGENADEIMKVLFDYTYSDYNQKFLKNEIVSMRRRVENALGSHKDKFEIKRGKGGIMDIDFISHYFQLQFGRIQPRLQIQSTRQAINEIEKSNYIGSEERNVLINGYYFLKRAETSLRLFDLKSVDSFPSDHTCNLPLARAMDFGNDTESFVARYNEETLNVRQVFNDLVGDIS